MKKKTKIILFGAIGLLAIGSLGLFVGTKINSGINNSIEGTMISGVEEGTGEFDWKKHDVKIEIDKSPTNARYHTNCEGDFIYNVEIRRETSAGIHNSPIKDYLRIYYKQYFNVFDNLQALFILTDGSYKYCTSIETSYIPVSYDTIDIPDSDYDRVKNFYISEIWVRTID